MRRLRWQRHFGSLLHPLPSGLQYALPKPGHERHAGCDKPRGIGRANAALSRLRDGDARFRSRWPAGIARGQRPHRTDRRPWPNGLRDDAAVVCLRWEAFPGDDGGRGALFPRTSFGPRSGDRRFRRRWRHRCLPREPKRAGRLASQRLAVSAWRGLRLPRQRSQPTGRRGARDGRVRWRVRRRVRRSMDAGVGRRDELRFSASTAACFRTRGVWR